MEEEIKEEVVKGKLNVVKLVKGSSREIFKDIDTRVRVIPRKKPPKGGAKNWRDYTDSTEE